MSQYMSNSEDITIPNMNIWIQCTNPSPNDNEIRKHISSRSQYTMIAQRTPKDTNRHTSTHTHTHNQAKAQRRR